MYNGRMKLRDALGISGKVTVNEYRTGMVEAVTPYLEQRQFLHQTRQDTSKMDRLIEDIKAAYFMRTALVCPNLVMDSSGYGLDIIIQRLVGINTHSLNITYGEIGTGQTTPALSDTALTTPTNRAAVGFQQDYGQTDAIVQFFFADSQLANQTYYEFGTFVDGTSTIGSGQLFNHALLSPTFTKTAGTDLTVQVDFTLANL